MSGCSEDLRVRATPKQSLKKVEIPLSQFRDVAVPYHIDLLKRHKVNIEKVRLCVMSNFYFITLFYNKLFQEFFLSVRVKNSLVEPHHHKYIKFYFAVKLHLCILPSITYFCRRG
jgi:hypothetical protein